MIHVTWGALALMLLLLLIPLAFFRYLSIEIKPLLIAVTRMVVQLFLVAWYLEYLFAWNLWWVNGLWIMVMVAVANNSIYQSLKIRSFKVWMIMMASLLLCTFLILAFMLGVAIGKNSMGEARYVIPIAGMLLGNGLRSIIIAMERFYADILKNEEPYITTLSLGASFQEATLPYFRQAARSAFTPAISSMATIGLVFLPGMMTGQILGGADPMTAIKYQICIFIGILVHTVLSVATTIFASRQILFNTNYILIKSFFDTQKI